jgi:hypothetical protein
MVKKKITLDDLKLTEANREVTRPQVDRLKKLIKEKGYINSLPIICDEDGFILDGQHRYVACKELGIEPPISVESSFDLVPIINSTQLKWGTKDYVHYYAVKGYEHFVILDRICKAKNLRPGIVYNIVMGKTVDRCGLSTTRAKYPLKDGSFKFPDISDKGLAKMERKIDKVLHIAHMLDIPKTDRLVVAIARLAQDSNFSFDTMVNKIEYQKARIYRCSTIQEYMIMLANIYNNKNSKKIAV